jgi:hypothetical protein
MALQQQKWLCLSVLVIRTLSLLLDLKIVLRVVKMAFSVKDLYIFINL